MSSSWRWKTYLFLALILGSVYALAPTFGHFNDIREAALATQEQAPSYLKYFPEKEMNLGLDLRGGIYIELEVRTEEALSNRLDLIASDLARFAKDEGLKFKRVERDYDHPRLFVEFDDRAHYEAFQDFVYKNFQDSLQFAESYQNAFFYTLTPTYRKEIKELTIRQAVETIRNRIDRYGVSEPSIHRLGDVRIAIELPGVKDPARAIELIKKAGKLEFKLVDESLPSSTLQTWVAEAQEAGIVGNDFSRDTLETLNQHLKNKLPMDAEIRFELQRDTLTRDVVGGTPYLLKKKAYVTGDMLKRSQVQVYNNEPYVSLSFNPLGTKIFAELTRDNIGKRLAILLDGNVSKAPVIQSEIPSGEAQITLGWGDYNALLKEAEDLTLVLNEGALPASFDEVTKTIVGPSLGKVTIQKGMQAVLIAVIAAVVFMLFFYRLSGLVANLALLCNLLFMLGILTLFQATLTLPGITGIALTMGMAVDANILIFERMREELRLGKTARAAIEAGYSNAMSAILDSNITTFLAGAVLYQFGTGPIRGFAVTLMIGVVTSLITSVTGTRLIYDYFMIKRKIQRVSL